MKRIEVITLLNSLAKSSYTNSSSVEAVLYNVKPYSYVVMLDRAIVLCSQAGLTQSFRRYKDMPWKPEEFLRVEYRDVQQFCLLDNRCLAVLWSSVVAPVQLEFSSLDDIFSFQTVISRHGEVLRELNKVSWSRPHSLQVPWPPLPPLAYGELYTTELRKEVAERGLRPEARQRGWLLLLELIPRSSDKNLGAFANQAMRDDYLRYRKQWHRMTEEQRQLNKPLLETVSQIEKDVVRLGSALSSKVKPELVAKILVAYALYDVDVNYGQGMADFVGNFLLVTREPHLAFACLKKFMQRYRSNFSPEGLGMETQIARFRGALASLCPELEFRETWLPILQPSLLMMFERDLPQEHFHRLLDIYFATLSTDFTTMFAVASFVQSRYRLAEFDDDQAEVYAYFKAYWGSADFEFLLALTKAVALRCLA